jgi:HK97 family phage major capsid protein
VGRCRSPQRVLQVHDGRLLSELDVEEQRALSKATGAAGNFLVPTDFYDQIIRSLRFMGSVAQLATEYVTDSGDSIQVPANTAHGIASWTAESRLVHAVG